MTDNYFCTTCTTLDSDDQTIQHTIPQYKEKLDAIFSTDLLWPQKSTIKIGFLSSGEGIERNFDDIIKDYYDIIDPLQFEVSNLSVIDMIKRVVKERLQPLVNLTFMFVDDSSTADVRISFEKKGCNSVVGTQALKIIDKNKATMNFSWINVWAILHEFGHCLGMKHEHQSSFSNIQWNKNKLYDWGKERGWNKQKVDNNVIKQLDGKNFTNSTFDPLSIMLYFFPPEFTLNNVGVRQNYRLSGKDVIWIAQTYPIDPPIENLTENFYFNAYKIHLNDSVAESDRLAKNYTPLENSFDWKIPVIISVVVLIFIGISIGLFIFYKNKNKKQYTLLKNKHTHYHDL